MTKFEVSGILQLAHDFGGHYAHTLTMKKLSKYWWPDMSKDCYKYILGCSECAEHGTKRKSETQSPIYIDQPNVLQSMDFIGPFPDCDLTIDEILNQSYPHLHLKRDRWTVITPESFESNTVDAPRNPRGFTTFSHVLLVVDYFTKFVYAFTTIGDNSDEVVRCLTWLFSLKGSPIAIYTDPGPHFESSKTQKFLNSFNVLWIPSPVGAKKATGMAEKCNNLLQRVMKKISQGNCQWPLILQESVFEMTDDGSSQ